MSTSPRYLAVALSALLVVSGLGLAAPSTASAAGVPKDPATFVPPVTADDALVVAPDAPTTSWGEENAQAVGKGGTANRAPAGTSVGAPGLGSLPWFAFDKVVLSPDVVAQINLGNGNLLLTASDGTLSGPGLATRNDRFYNGLSTVSGSFGGGWSSALSQIDFGLQVSGTTATFHGPAGLITTFTKSGSTWTPQAGFAATLTENVSSTAERWVITYNSSGEQLRFSTSGYITADLNRNGVGSHYAYNVNGQVATVTNDSGRQYTINWNGSTSTSKIQSIQDSAGRQVQYQMNSGSLDRVIKPNGNYENYTYDASGRLVQAVFTGTRAGDVQVDISYDSSSRVTSIVQREVAITNVLQSSTFAYTAGQTVVTDGNGHAATYAIDSQGRVTKATDALGNAKSQSWTANSDVATTTDALGAGSTPGNVTTYSYDQLNNASGVSYPTGAAASAIYAQGVGCPGAGSGNPYLAKCSKDDAGSGKSFSYDSAGNLTQVTDTTSGGTGATPQKYSYDNASHTVCGGFAGQICSATDGNGNVTRYTYDTHGNLITVTPPAPLGVTTYTPDSLGRVQYLQDGNNAQTIYAYNDRDQMIQQSPASMGTWSLAYFANGLQRSQQWNGISRELYYDGAGRLTQRTGPGAQSEQYTYDKVGNVLTFTDTNGAVAYGYDDANHLLTIAEPNGTCPSGTTAPPASSGCIKIAYDNNGYEIKRTFPGAATVTTARDLSGRATRITAKDASGAVRADIGYSFTVAGGSGASADRLNIQTRTSYLEQGIAAGAVTSYGYDSLNRLKTAIEKVGAATSASWAYSYDAAGNRTQQVRAGSTGAPAGSIGYTYNGAGELTATTADSTTWSYDGVGAQLKNGVTGQTQAVDNRGTVTAIGATAYTSYSPGNSEQLTRSAPATSFASSSFGLASETVAGSLTAFTTTSAGDLTSSRTGSSRSYFARDSLNSVVGVFDATGAWQGGYSYSPYGEQRSSASSTSVVANPLRYAGGYLDTSSGLYKLGARYYDSASGRFTQFDPSGQEANPYGYSKCNPINGADPTGLATRQFCRIANAVNNFVGAAAALTAVVGLASAPSGVGLVVAAVGVGVGAGVLVNAGLLALWC